MEFTDNEWVTLLKLEIKCRSPPYTLTEISKKLNISVYSGNLWRKPLIKKLKAMQILIPKHFSKPEFYEIDRVELQKAIAGAEQTDLFLDYAKDKVLVK